MHLQRSRHSIGQRTYLLHAEADRTAATDAAQLLGYLLCTVRLGEWAEYAQIQRDQPAQRFRQRRNIAACLTDVHEHLQRPMLVAVNRDVDLALRRAHLARVAVHHGRSWLYTLLDRSDRLH